MKLRYLAFVIAAHFLTACASTGVAKNAPVAPDYSIVANPYFAEIASRPSGVEKDRAAILAMRGDYRVDFNFQETVPLKAGYELHADKNTGGYETVIAVKQSPDKIVLQHILVGPDGHVIKHWRQDWTYEAKERFEFIADQSWEVRSIDAERVEGHWTQCVFEVSDAPRYCGSGEWNHRYGVSTWTSDRSWRPLPRREYTKRDDYNALNAENRHTVTPNGWTHEQDNTKTVREGQRTTETLVREFGLNDYRNIDGFEFAPAHDYWRETSDYWSRVRAAWDRRLQAGDVLTLKTEIDGMPIIEGTFAQADGVAEMTAEEQERSIEELLTQWTTVVQKVSSATSLK